MGLPSKQRGGGVATLNTRALISEIRSTNSDVTLPTPCLSFSACSHVHARRRRHTYVHAYIRAYMHTYTHTHIHTCIHANINACGCHVCTHMYAYIAHKRYMLHAYMHEHAIPIARAGPPPAMRRTTTRADNTATPLASARQTHRTLLLASGPRLLPGRLRAAVCNDTWVWVSVCGYEHVQVRVFVHHVNYMQCKLCARSRASLHKIYVCVHDTHYSTNSGHRPVGPDRKPIIGEEPSIVVFAVIVIYLLLSLDVCPCVQRGRNKCEARAHGEGGGGWREAEFKGMCLQLRTNLHLFCAHVHVARTHLDLSQKYYSIEIPMKCRNPRTAARTDKCSHIPVNEITIILLVSSNSMCMLPPASTGTSR